MACDNDPSQPSLPAAIPYDHKPSQPSLEKCPANPITNTTTIDSLSEDIILDIFLRLPSFTALVRVTFARWAWRRAVTSLPSFHRCFRALHPAPLLGLFFSLFNDHRLALKVPIFPRFALSRYPNRDLAGVIRTGDFFLTSIKDRANEAPDWDVVDCHGGFILLNDWAAESYTLLKPSMRLIHGFIDMPWGILVDMMVVTLSSMTPI
ncbi:hypothetical protein PR202_ga10587 [Eleusine coracana subsp. coracana]|uniref:F-box domain-containing protein n=1 Tax=Eleusine coracana subsp. coracana TaxID=191504 RepID=A0AAV5C775_ELECO|nr:hypothetical protein PR202_ga10587 [Eleusine coracana subsp. coracana]